MKLATLADFASSGRLAATLQVTRLGTASYRVHWLATAGAEGLLAFLAGGPRSLDELAERLRIGPLGHPGLAAWLQVGVDTGELGLAQGRYSLASALARRLGREEHDAALAMLQEISDLHARLLREAPSRLRAGRPLTLADQDGEVIARSSRLVEPFLRDAIRAFLPADGAPALLEIGCGTGVHLRHAAERCPGLTALGLELQPSVADHARANVARWGLAERVRVEAGDIRIRAPDPAWTHATLHQNIYYFPVGERVDLLRHVAGFLRPGGGLLLTTVCQGPDPLSDLLDLWGALTAGAGRLPQRDELVDQLGQAGFGEVAASRLVPGTGLYGFTARRQAAVDGRPPALPPTES